MICCTKEAIWRCQFTPSITYNNFLLYLFFLFFVFGCFHSMTLVAKYTKKLGSLFLALCASSFFVCPLFIQSSPFFTLFAIICFYSCALSCILQSQLFCIFQTQFLSSILLLLYSQGLFLFTIAQIAQHFQHSFSLWNCGWWLFVYCCIFNAILIILQLFLFDSCVVFFLNSCCFTNICVFVCLCMYSFPQWSYRQPLLVLLWH